MLLRRGCTWLTLMPLLLSLSTGELSFYRDALPETSEDALEHVARYLKTHRLQQRLHRSYQPMFLSPVHKEHDSLDRQNVLEALSDKALLRENMLKRKLKALHHRPSKYSMKIIETEYPATYYNWDIKHLDYPEEKQRNGDDKRFPKNFEAIFDMDKEMLKELMEDLHRKYANHNHAMDMFMHHEGGREAESAVRPVKVEAAEAADGPEFTFSFDDSNLEERHPFAVKPNDPRYYSAAPFSSDNFDEQDASRDNWKEEKSANKGDDIFIRHDDDTRSINRKKLEDSSSEFDGSGLDRFEHRAEKFEHHPIIVPINRDLNNDIYFIAIVAGCSAAAMFALVLISLTWCRLQRGAKAAADIEYPAYGVTGPNKDVSPSGDQRLAQSAQMYHFQHQKQQIIAMENRTSATRDPGSLSEAESDEENEEGDYTVYECPGLASTGEMEVKNPMFHDDPTPATPVAQGNTKEEDHI
ncbi:uncharacterized protein [Linepithema humile]|uniref:uncharacterized protein isoform X2 n=1 Tax=Linepithema humile TaxID=83485 RepID=UPI0006237D79|nr:PREDICTED: uncharacterized protein LOC105672036 isoform X2 [Linepithema humile]